MTFLSRALCASIAIFSGSHNIAIAQSIDLPTTDIFGTRNPRPSENAAPAASADSESLTANTADRASKEILRTPGGVAVVTSDAYRDTQAVGLKDILDYVPGVFVQPKWGEDSRLSIRGSGLSRNFHLRGVQLYMDGIPINTADGYGDFQEIDPTAYQHVEVYKGGNGLRFGANALGGAINFVTPTGRTASPFEGRIDYGSFESRKLQASTGGVSGRWDGFITGSWQDADGFREHSRGHSERMSANIGYQFSPEFETRFYFNANEIRQRIPGEVDKTTALSSPKTPNPANVLQDWQRNIDSYRLANVTSVKLDTTKFDFGMFGVDRHLMHPIFQWLDYHYLDYGAFARMVDERKVGSFGNRFVAGVNVHNGDIDAKNYVNNPGAIKGDLMIHDKQFAQNVSAYAENSFYFLPRVALVVGTQYLFAVRNQDAVGGLTPDPSFKADYSLWSPKVGLLWDVDRASQIFANISRSAEVPTFGHGVTVNFSTLRPQRATTYEAGARGRKPDVTWDLTVYRSKIKDEIQCLTFFFTCNETSVNRTIHQGVEAGFGIVLLKSLYARGIDPDRLWFNIAYTFSDFFFDRDAVFGNNQLPAVPRHYLRAEILYKHPNGFFFGPNVEWVPQSYFVDNANTFDSASYVLWGLRGGYDTGKNLSFFVEAKNLANRAYIANSYAVDKYDPANFAFTTNLFNPGTGRAIYAGVHVKL